ncbi:3-isopropylmalate dehydratase large subunit [Polaromonas sp.]|uniref:3-isopropylmalate dehydratase large subunit n=1 Tax=Polaromonas sp. TaxID=1869339 RepID=UPI003262FB61
MNQTIAQKILARASGLESVQPGEIITAKVDLALANDITAPMALSQMKAAGVSGVFNPDKICIVAGRHLPAKDPVVAMEVAKLRNFCTQQGIQRFYGSGGEGMDHALIQELGLARPGMLICNADSHACTVGALGCLSIPMGSTDMAYIFAFGETWLRVPESMRVRYLGKLAPYVTSKDLVLETLRLLGVDGAKYRSIEFDGPALADLTIDERFTITNMAIEMGAKTAVMAPDKVTDAYLERVGAFPYLPIASDEGAQFVEDFSIDADTLRPLVACPHSPSNVRPVAELKVTKVTQVNIGTCTNGRLIDLQQAAEIIRGRKIANGVRLMITPATDIVYRAALKTGLLEVFLDAGATINSSGCGPCGGIHMGVLGADDICVATHNRNFRGRMGHKDAQIYLASPYVAAATAVAGVICDPSEVMQ